MSFKISTAIVIARTILNDNDPEGYRYSDEDLIDYANGALRSLATIKPEWLHTEGELQCEAGKALQSVSFDDAHALVNVLRIKNGNVVTPCDKSTMDAFSPGWMSVTPAAAVHWMPQANDPRRFFIYPPAPADQVLEAIYVRIPGPYTADQETGLPETITEAVADSIVGMAESRDDEHVVSERAQQFMTQFLTRLKG